MATLLVVSKERGEGKTAVAAALARRVIAGGGRAVAIKPFGAGDEIGPESDAAIFARLLGTDAGGEPAAIPARGLTKKSMVETAKAVKALGHDLTVVEASSELSPGNATDLAGALDARVVVVARHRHGMTAADLADAKDQFGERLAGVVLNARGAYLATEASELATALEAGGTPVLGAIPDDRRLLGVTVRGLARHLDGRFLLGEDERGDELVEHFLVGGWMLDDGALYFGTRDDKAVIVRGDRPDLQMSALTTPTKVLVLTKGHEPIEYVRYEAGEEHTAVVVVERDTIATMDALGTVVATARFDHPAKLARMVELLDAGAPGLTELADELVALTA